MFCEHMNCSKVSLFFIDYTVKRKVRYSKYTQFQSTLYCTINLRVNFTVLYRVLCTMYRVQCTMYRVQCTMYRVQCTVHCTLYYVQSTVYWYSVLCMYYVYRVQYTVTEFSVLVQSTVYWHRVLCTMYKEYSVLCIKSTLYYV